MIVIWVTISVKISPIIYNNKNGIYPGTMFNGISTKHVFKCLMKMIKMCKSLKKFTHWTFKIKTVVKKSCCSTKGNNITAPRPITEQEPAGHMNAKKNQKSNHETVQTQKHWPASRSCSGPIGRASGKLHLTTPAWRHSFPKNREPAVPPAKSQTILSASGRQPEPRVVAADTNE